MQNDVRPSEMKRIDSEKLARDFVEEKSAELRCQIGGKKVLLALSGGVDSSVVAALLAGAIGKQLFCVHVNHGFLRKGESEDVLAQFRPTLGENLIYVDASERFLKRLQGVSDPEEKRKIVGAQFIEVFSEEAAKISNVSFLAQGTIYPDILESHGVKAHHNVGGLPEKLNFELVEPVKLLYKDEVRIVGKVLGLNPKLIFRQPFPGPGLAVRCTGAITKERLEAARESDAILRDEFEKAGLDGKIWQYFTVVPDVESVGIRSGKRCFEWPAVIRAVNSVDATAAEIPQIPNDVLQRVVERILQEVSGVNRVLFDISPKPPATIEWE